jgi:Fe-S cluster biogenesis protein NfuA
MDLLEKNELMGRVEEALDTMRAFLRADGGDVELLDIDDNMSVKIRLLGACASCQMSIMTMKAGIEEAVRKAVPTVKEVVAVEDQDVKLV